ICTFSISLPSLEEEEAHQVSMFLFNHFNQQEAKIREKLH
ncbi:hypothetical protein ISN45_Aa06g014270, partial [Arabidopsis thaliana x Arabidopsis arenosa]